jgi:hypothetical protein
LRSKTAFYLSYFGFGIQWTMTLLLHALVVFLCASALITAASAAAWIVWKRTRVANQLRKQQQKQTQSQKNKVLAFFHPHCAAGGGGERVLWKIIEVLGRLQEQGFALEVIIYTIDRPSVSYKDGTSTVCVPDSRNVSRRSILTRLYTIRIVHSLLYYRLDQTRTREILDIHNQESTAQVCTFERILSLSGTLEQFFLAPGIHWHDAAGL